jgi:hypothetical protein
MQSWSIGWRKETTDAGSAGKRERTGDFSARWTTFVVTLSIDRITAQWATHPQVTTRVSYGDYSLNFRARSISLT